MTRVLDELGAYLEWRGHSFLRLDGTSGGAQERGELVRRFNDPGAVGFGWGSEAGHMVFPLFLV